MIKLKTEEEIQIMKVGGKKLRNVLKKLEPEIKAGVTTREIDNKAEKLILDEGGSPSFKRVKGYSWTTCLSINEQIVHTPPSARVVKEGDLLTLDIGLFYKGYHVDYATSILIGQSNKKIDNFLDTGKDALIKAISQVKIGNYLYKISEKIEETICNKGYFIIKQLTGHGIGRELHEDPYIPGYADRSINNKFKIKQGLTIAIEVIYSFGTEEIKYEKDNNWSIITADNSLSACFEHTVAVSKTKVEVLT